MAMGVDVKMVVMGDGYEGLCELTGLSRRQWRAAAISAITPRDVVIYNGQM